MWSPIRYESCGVLQVMSNVEPYKAMRHVEP